MSSAHLKLSASYLGSCTLVHSNLHTAPGASHRIPTIKLLESHNAHMAQLTKKSATENPTASHRGHCLTEQQSSTHSTLAYRASEGLQTAAMLPQGTVSSLLTARAFAHREHHLLTQPLHTMCTTLLSQKPSARCVFTDAQRHLQQSSTPGLHLFRCSISYNTFCSPGRRAGHN